MATTVTLTTEIRVGGYVLNFTQDQAKELRDKLLELFPVNRPVSAQPPMRQPVGRRDRDPITWPKPLGPYEVPRPPEFDGPGKIWCVGPAGPTSEVTKVMN